MKRKALLVHDDLGLLGALRTQLQRRHFLTLAARKADDALDLFLGIAPDVVLLGVALDASSGGRLSAELQKGGTLLLIPDPPGAAEAIAAEAAAMVEAAAAGFGRGVVSEATGFQGSAPPLQDTTSETSPLETPASRDAAAPLAGDADTAASDPASEVESDALASGPQESDAVGSDVVASGPAPDAQPDPVGSESQRTPTVILPHAPDTDAEPGRVDTLITDFLPYDAYEGAPDDRAVLSGELDDPLYHTQVSGPAWQGRDGRGEDDDSLSDEYVPTRQQLNTDFFDLAFGRIETPGEAQAQARSESRETAVSARTTDAGSRPEVDGPPFASFPSPATAVRTAASELQTGPKPDGYRGGSILLIDDRAVERGDLFQVPFPTLLVAAYRSRVDGAIRFTRDDIEKTVSFSRGSPIFARSNDPADRLSELLFREGRLTRLQNENARLAAAGDRRAGALLLDMGYLKERELIPAVTRQLEHILFSLFEWRGGTFRFLPGDPPLEEGITLSTPVSELLLEGVRRKIEPDRLRRLVSKDAIAAGKSPAGALSEELGLTPQEGMLVAAVDGIRSVDALLQASKLREVDGLRVLYAASVLGGIELKRSTPPAAGETKPLTMDPSELFAAAEEHGDTSEDTLRDTVEARSRAKHRRPEEAEIDRERLRAMYAQVSSASYFQILGVGPAATEYEVQRAYEALAATFDSALCREPTCDDVCDEGVVVAQVLRDACDVLSDERLRQAYAIALESA